MFDDLRLRLRSLLRKSAVESDLNDELRFHADFCSADLQVGIFDFGPSRSNGEFRC
jgi:hypothetical protein